MRAADQLSKALASEVSMDAYLAEARRTDPRVLSLFVRGVQEGWTETQTLKAVAVAALVLEEEACRQASMAKQGG